MLQTALAIGPEEFAHFVLVAVTAAGAVIGLLLAGVVAAEQVSALRRSRRS